MSVFEDSSAGVPHPNKLKDVDLFGPGAEEHWYDAYAILHREAPVHRLPGEGLTPETDAFILSRYEDIVRSSRSIRYPHYSLIRNSGGRDASWYGLHQHDDGFHADLPTVEPGHN